MSQHDYVLENANGATYRADGNALYDAMATLNSGATAPTTTFANMWWADTSTNILKRRNNANTAWISFGDLAAGVASLELVNAFTKTQSWSKGADVASAAALPILTDGNYFDVTGTTTVTSINTLGIGTVIKLHFDGTLTLTHHATNLILPSGANVTTAAGDEFEFVEYASGDWRCTGYVLASGSAIVDSGAPEYGYAVGRYYSPAGLDPSGTAWVPTTSQIYYWPFIVNKTATFTRIGMQVSTAESGKLARLGIYNFADGIPTTKLLDAGTISTTSSGVQEIVISQELEAGIYCVAMISDRTTATFIRGLINGAFTAPILGSLQPNTEYNYLDEAGAGTTLPATASPTPQASTANTGNLFLRVV